MAKNILAAFEVNAEKLKEVECGDVTKAFSWASDSGVFLKEHAYVEGDFSLDTVWLLTETLEIEGGIREFNILTISPSKTICEQQMQMAIEKDYYQLIKKNGVNYSSETHFETCLGGDNSFVCYEIIKKPLCFKAEKNFTFIVHLCDGKECGEVTVSAKTEEEAEQLALSEVCEKLAKTFPEFDIEVSVRLKEV